MTLKYNYIKTDKSRVKSAHSNTFIVTHPYRYTYVYIYIPTQNIYIWINIFFLKEGGICADQEFFFFLR